ncbi:MAG: hypothetical protein PF569_09705 [Candidatus Woesearchaeota archaeon]|jgi:hypothetical protein|nr:hypothetical protein [Candidatus Woesearchaeota archaeon]
MNNFSKKGVASFATFSLIIILCILVLSFSFGYYNSSKEDMIILSEKAAMIKSMSNFRSELLNVVVYNGSSLEYVDFFSNNLEVILQDNFIHSSYAQNGEIVEVNISTLGPNFCSVYNVSFGFSSIYSFNGSCISVTN